MATSGHKRSSALVIPCDSLENFGMHSILSPVSLMRWLILSALSALSAQVPASADESSIEQHEALAIASSGGMALRAGKMLTLQLASGDPIRLINGDSCTGPNDCHFYVYGGLLGNKQFFMVEELFYEGGNTLLFSRQAGTRYNVFGKPHLSPNGKFIVVASDAEAYGTPGLFLWEIRNGGLIGRYIYEPTEYELFRFLRWNGSDEVHLIETTHSTKKGCPDNSVVEFPVRLITTRSGWELKVSSNKSMKNCQ